MMAEMCHKYNVLCISDEVYEWLIYDDNVFTKIGQWPLQLIVGLRYYTATLPGMWDRTITIGSGGKTFSMTGWKVSILLYLCSVHFDVRLDGLWGRQDSSNTCRQSMLILVLLLLLYYRYILVLVALPVMHISVWLVCTYLLCKHLDPQIFWKHTGHGGVCLLTFHGIETV